MSDPIANMISKLKNATDVNKQAVSIPFSEMKWSIAELLQREGYVKNVSKKGKKIGKTIEVELVEGGIRGFERLSKFSRRLYTAAKTAYPVKQGQGTLVLTTPKGILSDREARKEKVGGEALFKIW